MKVEIVRDAESIKTALDRFIAKVAADAAEIERLKESLTSFEGLQRSASESVERVMIDAEENLRAANARAGEALDEANARAEAAEAERAKIKRAADNLARVLDEGGFDVLRGEEGYKVIDELVACLGTE